MTMGIRDKVRHAFGSGEGGAEAPSPQEIFLAEVEAALRKSPSVTSVRHGEEGFSLIVDQGGAEHTIFLDNTFAETRDMSPEQRRERIARLVRSGDAPDASAMSWEEVRPKLASLLRTPSLFGGVPQFVGDRLPIHRPFAPFLIECVGVDSDDGIGYVVPHMVAKWGVEPSDVFAAATDNGREYFVDDVESFDARAPYPLWHVARDDSYESSRLLVPGWLASFADKVKGRPVAIVPHRSLLVVGGDGDERCLRRLIASAKAEFEASPRGISPALYTTDETGVVVPLTLPVGHPLAADVAVGHVMMAMAEYDFQKTWLDEQLEEDVFVASYQGLQEKDGGVFSYSTWSCGVLSLLPVVDRVALGTNPGKKGAEVLWVPWKGLVEIAGACLALEPNLDPPRWRTVRWPDDGQLAKLRAIAV
jgi:hypothetical protein